MKIIRYSYFLFLFLFISFFFHVPTVHGATCTPRTYTECEKGNPTACLGTGSGSTHNVPKGNRADVTVHSDCSYTCVNRGKCTTPTPTQTQTTQTPTPTVTGQTTADVTFHMEGIDAANLPSTSPQPGIHTSWPFTLFVYNGSTLVNSYNDIAAGTTDPKNPLYGTFHNPTFSLGSLASGSYTFYVTTPFGALKTQIGTTAMSITSGNNNILVPNNATTPLSSIPFLRMGDINQDGVIDITDYGILRQCFGDNATSPDCATDRDQLLSKFPSLPKDFIPGDLNDNGVVDGIDYNIFIRGFIEQENTTPTPTPTTTSTPTPTISPTTTLTPSPTITPTPTVTPTTTTTPTPTS